MSLSARIEADSVAPDGTRLTTFVLRYHRFVHAELMTHRVFSRNSSSSRAIPVEKMIQWTLEDPAVPVEWGKNQKGMQAKELLDPETAAKAELVWLNARDKMIDSTHELLELGVHKQIANRLLEPWHHIAVIVSSTQWANWFSLRWHKDAQPEIRELAKLMAVEYRKSTPRALEPGQWHLPFINNDDYAQAVKLETDNGGYFENLESHERVQHTLIKCSVARCARVSYMNHDGTKPDTEKDIKLHDMLVVQRPLHASPAEHQATPLAPPEDPRLAGNFRRGWKQYRKTLSDECAETFPWEADETAAV